MARPHSMPNRLNGLALLAALAATSCGGNGTGPAPPANPPPGGPGLSLRDDIDKSNTQPGAEVANLKFVDSEGNAVDLRGFQGKKNLVLVVLRGFPGFICPYCSAQTSGLIANYEKFKQRDTEILLVFPGPSEHLPDFRQAVQGQKSGGAFPFPLLLDKDYQAIEKLGIRGDKAKPSTYILDKKGQVRFAYVGINAGDRPSVKALLKQLDQLQ